MTGSWVEFPFHGEPIRLSSAYRSWNLEYEYKALDSLQRQIRPGNVVWDIGANIGIYTILSGQRVGTSGQVIAWEPHPQTVQVLKSHVRANGIADRCKVIEAAVSDGTASKLTFNLEQDHTTSRLALSPANDHGNTILTEVKSLDEWREELGRQPHLLKIDVEGAEVLVLRGGTKLLSGHFGSRPLILIAIHPQYLPEFGCDTTEIEQLCRRFDYIAYDLERKTAAPTQYAEYWLVPEEQEEQFISMI
jgi:FkbM family methyltransferase